MGERPDSAPNSSKRNSSATGPSPAPARRSRRASAVAEANRLRVQQPSLVDQARDRALRWLDELAQAVGL